MLSYNIRPYLLSEMSITVLGFMSVTCVPIYGLMFRILTWFHTYALLWRVMYRLQFYCLTLRYFGWLSILTGKADAMDFAVLVFTGNTHFQ